MQTKLEQGEEQARKVVIQFSDLLLAGTFSIVGASD
jgi:hypothetical protein